MTHYYSECSNNFGISGTRILTEKDTASSVFVFVLFRFVINKEKIRALKAGF